MLHADLALNHCLPGQFYEDKGESPDLFDEPVSNMYTSRLPHDELPVAPPLGRQYLRQIPPRRDVRYVQSGRLQRTRRYIQWRILIRRKQGFVYAGLLVALVVMGLAMAALGDAWHGLQRRERERELLFAGHQFREALLQYYLRAPVGAPRYPFQLNDLLRDPRVPSMKRYLRKIYVDPMTGSTEWGLIRGVDGAIYGVHSLSQEHPLKRARFARIDQTFVQAISYADWIFMFSPGQAEVHSSFR